MARTQLPGRSRARSHLSQSRSNARSIAERAAISGAGGKGFCSAKLDHAIAVKPDRRRGWIYVVIVAGAISVSLFFLGRYTAWFGAGAHRTESSGKSIAVLPFENLSDDKANAYFATGIQDEIMTRLAKIADLKVISRTSIQQYQSKPG